MQEHALMPFDLSLTAIGWLFNDQRCEELTDKAINYPKIILIIILEMKIEPL